MRRPTLCLARELLLSADLGPGVYPLTPVALDSSSEGAYLSPVETVPGEKKRFETPYHRVCAQREGRFGGQRRRPKPVRGAKCQSQSYRAAAGGQNRAEGNGTSP